MGYRKVKSVAYPGLPVIFAEGYRKTKGRVSYHDSVGLCITDLKRQVRTETVVEGADDGVSFTVDGEELSGNRGRGMLKIIEIMLEKSDYRGGLNVESKNHGILTGSSDSGAAALLTALDSFLGLNLPDDELLVIGLCGSETVFRSLYGGLTEYRVGGSKPEAEVLSERLGVSIFAVPFDVERYPADKLHRSVVSHPEYPRRESSVRERIDTLKAYVRKGNVVGVLQLMEDDARDCHRMFTETGHEVIKPEMQELCDHVESLRKKGLNSYWNVSGGSVVYVFCPADEGEKVAGELGGRWKCAQYKTAVASRII
ncbi:MAG: hypothetical protein V1921_04745 [Candidatus Altiarchaeota archaeon]